LHSLFGTEVTATNEATELRVEKENSEKKLTKNLVSSKIVRNFAELFRHERKALKIRTLKDLQ
jgi:hypothetical protein